MTSKMPEEDEVMRDQAQMQRDGVEEDDVDLEELVGEDSGPPPGFDSFVNDPSKFTEVEG